MTEQTARISDFVQRLEDAGIRLLAVDAVANYIEAARQELAGMPISGFLGDALLDDTDRRMTRFLQAHGPSLLPEWKRLLRTLTVQPVYAEGNNG